ncbi:uncharacterized protein si:ch1073-291c23.2 [Chanos chanos]|uniref:Uncharacterized protein LOC115809374 n=1 Tax=Chanos chanos TaxID=29144 RepID=A0A6J2V3K1_CHACN|nr:uncharacterized protein LOC115809374 [Chanos chanos]XP_030626844.1 uncharacterized protein LOC115809374 [Chanos chanos]
MTMSMDEVTDISPVEGDAEPRTEVMGGTKPLHRFLRGEVKYVGIALVILGSSMFIFGIPLKRDWMESSADFYSSFWMGILFGTCGILYILSERNPTKKIVAASMAVGIIAIVGVLFACVQFVRAMLLYAPEHHSAMDEMIDLNYSHPYSPWIDYHYYQLCALEGVFLSHSLAGGVILIVMTGFARTALKSSKAQAVVIMQNLPSAESALVSPAK